MIRFGMNFSADNQLVIVINTTEGGGCVRARVSEAESVICLGKDMIRTRVSETELVICLGKDMYT